MHKRIEHIDIAKGLSLLLVVTYHIEKYSGFDGGPIASDISNGLSVVRMPLFFLVSGVFFSYKQDWSTFLIRKSEGLLKPYFFMLLMVLLFSYLMGGEDIGKRFLKIFFGLAEMIDLPPLWFLNHLFVVFLFSYLICRFTPFPYITNKRKWLFVILIGAAGVTTLGIIHRLGFRTSEGWLYPDGLPFSADIVFLTGAFFLAGYMLRNQIKEMRINLFFISLALVVYTVIDLYTEAFINIPVRKIDDPFFAMIGSFSGIYLALQVSLLISREKYLKALFNKVGESTLFILIFHWPIISEGKEIIIDFSPVQLNNFIIGVILLFLSIAIPIFIKSVVEKSAVLSLFFFPIRNNKLVMHYFR